MTATDKVEASIEAFKAALLLQPVMLPTAVPQVLILDGPPGPNQPDDIIAIGTRTEETTTPHALTGDRGPGSLLQDMVITCVISCFSGGDSASTVRKRAYQLLQAFHDAVNGDPTLGGVCFDAWVSHAEFDVVWEQGAKGPVCEGPVEITCRSIMT